MSLSTPSRRSRALWYVCVSCGGGALPRPRCAPTAAPACSLSLFAPPRKAVVSHDQYFLSKVAKEYWALDAGRVDVYTEFGEAKRACYTAAA